MTIFIKILFSIICGIGVINPNLSWKLSEGWKFKNAEPSLAYLIMTRVISAIMLVVIWIIMPM